QKGWLDFLDNIYRTASPDVRMRVLYGFEVQTLPGQLMSYFAAPNGVLVSNVTEKEKAARAGLRAGDVIIKAGEKPIDTLDHLIEALDAATAPVEITISRRREHMKITLQR
ncbi:MAG: PDZ domain-containing protein, partial [Blastocatellia bacterium]